MATSTCQATIAPGWYWWPVGIGGGVGLLLLLRPQFILLIPAILLLVVVIFYKRPRQGLGNLGMITLGLILTLSPWLWRSYQITGKFTLNDPSQMAFLTEQYHLEPQTESVIVLPGDAGDDYTQRINDYLRNFVFQHPGLVTSFITSHFAHNVIEMVQALPMTFWYVQNPDSDLFPYWRQKWARLWDDCCSVQSYVDAVGFWDPTRKDINSNHYLPILFNLILISFGLGVSWNRQDIVGWIPLGLSLFYSLSTAVGRYSGWRLILPADWVIFLYIAIGIGQITLWLNAYYAAQEADTTVDAKRKTTWQMVGELPEKTRIPPIPVIMLCLILLGIGITPLIVDAAVPQRYESLAGSDVLDSLISFDNEEIQRFLELNNATVVEGRALYPRFYRTGDGEPGEDWVAFMERDFPRLGFFLIGSEKVSVIMPMDKSPEIFPHAADVIVVGCREDDYIDAAVVLISSESLGDYEVLFRPSLENLSCPLPSP
jgi:hypothetical protein